MVFLGAISTAAQNEILLKDYRPKSIHKTPKTKIKKAKFPVIDMHSHGYAKSKEEIEQWIRTMNAFGIEKTIILSGVAGKKFDSIYNIYSKYNDRFEVWCAFDYTGYEEGDWSQKAVKELERCYSVGAKGVGELADKGLGLFSSFSTPPAYGLHIDDKRMQPLLEKCGELKMPINIHVAEPYWMYEPIDVHNDGLMNAAEWKIDTSNENILLHAELIETLENVVRDNPWTTFIACHFANCSYDLSIIGRLLGTYDNLYADISARYGETATTPKYTRAFYEKYQDKLLYGTDLGFKPSMYEGTFRILETEDEHFYDHSYLYHWALYGLGLKDSILKKIYNENAQKIIK